VTQPWGNRDRRSCGSTAIGSDIRCAFARGSGSSSREHCEIIRNVQLSSRVGGSVRSAFIVALAGLAIASCSGSTAGRAIRSPESAGSVQSATTSSDQALSSSHPAATSEPASSRFALPSSTDVKFYNPFDASSGSVVVPIKRTRSGSCWSESVAVSDPRAFRCIAGNEILDPCFSAESFSTGSVVCTDSPWANGTRLKLTAPLPTSSRSGPAKPTWALELVNGDQCVQLTGTGDVVAGIAMSYGCRSGAEAGGMNRRSNPWTVEYRPPRSSIITDIAVMTAWG
jgi:hypothetical protein